MKKHWLVTAGNGRYLFATKAEAIADAERVAKASPGTEAGVYEFVGAFTMPKVPTWIAPAPDAPIARVAG